MTGAGSGIGRALAIALCARGATVIAADIDVAAAQKLTGCTAAHLDVTNAVEFGEVISRIVETHGRLDYLFNNAGTAVAGEAQEQTIEHWDRVLQVNVYGTVNGVLAAYPLMLRQKSGHIVNVASLAGLAAGPFLVPYAASKHAAVGLSTSLRVEAADYGVRVSVVCPAAVETPLLDRDNPADLPAISWRPNMRRHLERLAGPPVSAESVAEEALAGVAKNKAIIVVPARARLAWRLMRIAPGLVEAMAIRATRAERMASTR